MRRKVSVTLAPAGEIEVSAALRDVGTYDEVRDVLGENGFDVPTLLGLHISGPYLHDGSARSLVEVLANPIHAGRVLTDHAVEVLTDFLRTIDGRTSPF